MTCVVDAFRDPGADHIVLRHCTGIDAIPTLYQRLPKQAVVSPVGTT